MKENKLEIGDKVYLQTHQRWGNDIYYTFAEVVKLTNTQAVLSNDVKLVNIGKGDHWDSKKELKWSKYGDNWERWQIVTDKVLREAKIEKERQSINRWYSNRKFSEQEIKIIYDRFVELDLLKPKDETQNEGR